MNFFDLTSLNYQVAESTYNQFESLVQDLMKLLIQGMAIHVGFSTGKDSSVVMNAGIEAMRRCLVNGDIEQDRPLVVITVDTLLEPNNIQMYVPYAHNQVKALCEEHGINLHLKLVAPPLHQQLMVLYAGAQKLFATSASGRNADCSAQWKLETSKRALKETMESLPQRYRNGKWVNLSGVREGESTRRKSNMIKRGEAGLTADMLLEQVRRDGEGFGYYRFAPIANWTTRDVINCLNHAGISPMKKMPSGMHIPCYGNNFGLLLAIYGEGSNDVCQVGENGSCGGVARFGCQCCGMVSVDRSGQEMLQYPRWARFGDDVLRFRDYLVRASVNVEYRAFHPRATCSVTSNVYLQPNVLKASVLENMLYQAAQITVKHRKIHAEFVNQLNEGDILSDAGVVDIQNDPALRDDVKRDYIEAYINRMSDRPMLELFTEKHAVMLSALWSLHGVKSAPYRPMKILDNVKKGHRKPLPLLNSELNASRLGRGLAKWDDSTSLNKEIPDALVFQLFAPAKRFDPTITNLDKLSHWMPLDFTKFNMHLMAPLLRDLDNALIHRDRLRPSNVLTLKLKYSTNGVSHKLCVYKTSPSGKLNVKVGSRAYNELLKMAQEKMQAELSKISNRLNTSNDAILARIVKDNGAFDITFHAELPYAKEFVSAFGGVNKEARSRKTPGIRFTKRKRTKQGSRFITGRTSLQDYNPSTKPELLGQHQTTVGYWLPDATEKRAQQFSLYDFDMDADFVHNMSVSMDFVDSKFEAFMEKHWDIAIGRHDAHVRSGYTSRTGSRKFVGTGAFHSLMKSSGLNMAPRFQEYVNRSLVRTEIFHASHIFNLSDRRYDDVIKASHVVSMAEHRNQKANQLLAVRRARNILRSELKSILNNQYPDFLAKTIGHRVIEFLSNYEDQAFAMSIHASHQGLTNKPSLTLRGAVNQMWMEEFGPVAIDFGALLKLLTSSNELSALRSDYVSMQAVFEVYRNKMFLVRRSLQERSDVVLDCLVFIENNIKPENLIDDGMGNMEMDNPDRLSPIVNAYLSAGATRNRFLTEMAVSNTLAVSMGLRSGEQGAAASCFLAANTELQSATHDVLSALEDIDYDTAIRKVVTLECRASTIPVLSQDRKDRLAALRA